MKKVGKQFTYTDIGMTDLGVVNTPVFEEMNILGAEITIYASEDITLGNGITYYKADEEIETLVSNYTKTEVDIFISILCVRFMKEHNISKEELFESLSSNINRLTFGRKYLS